MLKDVTTVVEAKVEADQDVRLAIRDDHGVPTDRMIVEFPNSDCERDTAGVPGADPESRRAVSDFINLVRTGGNNGWVQLHRTARIAGVGFLFARGRAGAIAIAPRDDPFEHEAERVARELTRRTAGAGAAGRAPAGAAAASVKPGSGPFLRESPPPPTRS